MKTKVYLYFKLISPTMENNMMLRRFLPAVIFAYTMEYFMREHFFYFFVYMLNFNLWP